MSFPSVDMKSYITGNAIQCAQVWQECFPQDLIEDPRYSQSGLRVRFLASVTVSQSVKITIYFQNYVAAK